MCFICMNQFDWEWDTICSLSIASLKSMYSFWATDAGCTADTETSRRAVFEEFISCNFSRHNESKKEQKTSKHAFHEIGRGNFPFRNKHRRLCSPPFCWRDLSNDPAQCNSDCPDVDLSVAERVCRSKVPVMKAIRVCRLSLIREMLSKIDVRVILLIRDPRGIYNSRKSLLKDLTKSGKNHRLFTLKGSIRANQ